MGSRPWLWAGLGALAWLGCAQGPKPLLGGPEVRQWPGKVVCTEPRPDVCTREYRPVCGRRRDGDFATDANACTACANPDVIDYSAGACPPPPPPPPPLETDEPPEAAPPAPSGPASDG